MIKIDGIFRLTSPLFIAAPGEARYNFASSRFTGSDQDVPCTRVRRERFVAAGMAEADDEGAVYVPVIPSNGLRGALRRASVDVLVENFPKDGKKMSLDAYHTLTCGAAIGQPDSETPTVPEIIRLLDHPLIGLFGGTTKMIRSSLRVFNGYPVCPATQAAGSTSERFASFKADSNWLTQVAMFKRDDDTERDVPPSALKALADPEKSIQAWRDFLDGKVSRTDSADPSKASLRTWSSREVVLPGTSFQIGFEVHSNDYAKVGLLLLSLERLLNKNALGGRTSIGYGSFAAKELTLRTVENGQGTPGATIFTESTDGYSLNMASDEIKGYVDAAREFLSTVSVDEIEDLCRPNPKKPAAGKE